MAHNRPVRPWPRPRLEIGRALARVLCLVLSLVGAIPIALGAAARTEPVRRFAAAQTADLLSRLLGVQASYRVSLELVPLRLVVDDLRVAATDGGEPALTARRVSVTPRFFSLLAGRFDAGSIEVQEPRARVILKDGELVNVRYRLPQQKGPRPPMERAPFSSLSLTDARVSLDVDGIKADAGPIDADVFAEAGPAFELAVRAGESHVTRTRKARDTTAVDEDVICELDARVRMERGSALVRRLSLVGVADADPNEGTLGSCHTGENDPGRVAVRLSEVRAVLDDAKPSLIDGHVVARAPLAIANRFAKGPFRGWVGFAGDVRWDAQKDLPEVRAKIRGGGVEMGAYKFAKTFDGDLDVSRDEIRVKTLHATYGHANVLVEGLAVRPLAKGVPLRIHRVETHGLRFPDLMENNDVTPNTIVEWNLDKVLVTEFGGTLDPLKLDGDVVSDTSGFEVFDRAYHAPARKHLIGVKSATVKTRFGVRPDAIQFMNSQATFGSSHLAASVSVGFHNDLWLSVPKGGKIDLADVSPLVDIPMHGTAELSVSMAGKASQAVLEGDARITNFVFAGFPLGDVESAKVRFKPLVLDLVDVHGVKGTSRFTVPSARLDFDSGATLLADAQVSSDRFDLRDFFAMWHFEEDPRFDQIAGRGSVNARIHYDLGGPKDQCKTGYLRVEGSVALDTADFFEEHYDVASSDFDFRWIDLDASYLGMELDATSVTMKKGRGTILGSLQLRDGSATRGHFVASGVPLDRIDALGAMARGVDAQTSAVAEVSGSLDALKADVDAHIGPARIGRATLPGSDLHVHLEPIPRPPATTAKTACGRPKPGEFDHGEYDRDLSQGVFHTSGQLFGGQVAFTDLSVSRQKDKIVRGNVTLRDVDLGAIAELSPVAAASDQRLEGRVSGSLSIEELPMAHAGLASVTLALSELRIGRQGFRLELTRPARLSVGAGRLDLSDVGIAAKVATGESALFDLKGGVADLGATPRVDVTLAMRPVDVRGFARFVPQAERMDGTFGGQVRVTGPWTRLQPEGRFTLERGELSLRGLPVTLSNLEVAVGITPDEIRVVNARADVGGGTLEIRGSAPLRGFEIGAGRASIVAQNVSLPVADGVRSTADLALDLALPVAPKEGAKRVLPKLSGDVTLRSFRYSREVTMSADIDTLTKRGHRTHFESYDPANDVVDIDIRVRAARPLEIDTDLIDAKLIVAEPGLTLSGTNQRFGMRGELDVVKGGRIRLRRNEFEITQGLVRFDDEERIAPRVDVTAVTDYHRYDESFAGSAGSSASSSGTSGTAGASTAAGGRWRITMRAHGDPETLRIDLSSEPALSQDDIFLLLTLGITRAELDRAQSATAGSSVALEALGSLTGADEAVQKNIPVIDEFKLGSAYDSRTGRTEPTVTIGKRLAQRIRAYVTSGLTESREVRSNLELRVSPRVSVEGSYDNVNDISTGLGNLGADIRWRLEFE